MVGLLIGLLIAWLAHKRGRHSGKLSINSYYDPSSVKEGHPEIEMTANDAYAVHRRKSSSVPLTVAAMAESNDYVTNNPPVQMTENDAYVTHRPPAPIPAQ